MKSHLLKLACLNGKPEIFHSIQGEGKSLGLPSIFVRTSLCNLHCNWCDTDYTWNWEGTKFPHQNDSKPEYRKFDKNKWLTTQTVEETAQVVATFPCFNVILTGGEPMLQQTLLVDVMQLLRQWASQYRFEVETNGTILPSAAFDATIDQYNVSPKLANSGNSRIIREKSEVIRFFAMHPKANFKFVLLDEKDLKEVLEWIQTYAIAPEKIWIMPEGSSADHLEKRRIWMVELCKKYGFRYSDRLHIQIWGGKKGV